LDIKYHLPGFIQFCVLFMHWQASPVQPGLHSHLSHTHSPLEGPEHSSPSWRSHWKLLHWQNFPLINWGEGCYLTIRHLDELICHILAGPASIHY